jgi:Ca-activated chloride channel family protein
LLLAGGGAEAADFWASLWRNADQRGEQLLRQGDAAAAARTYADPRRRAHAEFQAGDYAAAARDFAAFDDADAHYNRGNALAHAGDPEAALEAFDAALARDPGNRDARHNRDLVARALKQQPQQQPPPAPKQGGGQDRPGQQNPNEDSAKDSGQGAGKDAASSGKPAGEGREGREQPAKPDPAGDGQRQSDKPEDKPEADQARRDAEMGLTRPRPGENTRGPGLTEVPRNEQQLAREQWLRQIPDDPGGLLRRKFMIEHLMRQQGQQR